MNDKYLITRQLHQNPIIVNTQVEFSRPVLCGPCQANLVLIAYASSKGSGEPAHPRSLARTSALTHTSSESRGTFRQKAKSLAPLNDCACAVKICHDGMLKDTNSLDVAHVIIDLYYAMKLSGNVTDLNYYFFYQMLAIKVIASVFLCYRREQNFALINHHHMMIYRVSRYQINYLGGVLEDLWQNSSDSDWKVFKSLMKMNSVRGSNNKFLSILEPFSVSIKAFKCAEWLLLFLKINYKSAIVAIYLAEFSAQNTRFCVYLLNKCL